MKRLLAAAILTLSVIQFSMACTAFCMCSENRAVLEKNLDWPVDAGLILVNRSGIQKSSFSITGRVVTWESRYSSLTFNQFGKEFPLGGMNEQGLVVEELNMPMVQNNFDGSKQILNEFQLVQYMLDNFKSLEEIEVTMDQFQSAPLLLSLHYLIMDREGRSMIMEFDGTQFRYYQPDESGYPVLSNNLYPESLRYLQNFQGFGGEQEVQHRPGSNERFVSVASMLSEGKTNDPVRRSFEILDSVAQSDTRWSIVYDAARLTINLKFHSCSDTAEICLDKVLVSADRSTQGADVSHCMQTNPDSFRAISVKENSELIYKVFNHLGEELDLSHRREIFNRLISYSNQYIID